jgi:hypothetical protein
MDCCTPDLRISEVDGHVRLGLDGFGEVEGASLQEAGDALVDYVLNIALTLRSGAVGALTPECCVDRSLLEFVWCVSEIAAAGGDPREALFGPNPLAM